MRVKWYRLRIKLVQFERVWRWGRHTYTQTQTRNTCANTYLSAQGNRMHINKLKAQAQTHQQARTQEYARAQCEQQTHKNKNEHEHGHNHMCEREESASAWTWVGRVHVSVMERRETERGWDGVPKGKGGALCDTHDHGGTPREKCNTTNRPKKTTKTTPITRQKYTVPKQGVYELKQQNEQSKKQKKNDSTTETTQQETQQQNRKNRKQLLMP